MKLRQNGTVSFSIRLAAFQARGGARVKLHIVKVSFSIKLVASAAGGRADPPSAEHLKPHLTTYCQIKPAKGPIYTPRTMVVQILPVRRGLAADD